MPYQTLIDVPRAPRVGWGDGTPARLDDAADLPDIERSAQS